MTDVQVLSMLFCFGFEIGAAKQQLQKWELKFVTELEPLEGASPVPCYFYLTWSFHNLMHIMQEDTYSTCSPGPV